jgi:hypothetical protein
MDIRIDYISSDSKPVFSIAGRLGGSAVIQLKKACDPIEEPMMMDLTNLLFADDRGIDAIRSLIDRGWQIRGASPFVQLLLKKAPERKTGSVQSELT